MFPFDKQVNEGLEQEVPFLQALGQDTCSHNQRISERVSCCSPRWATGPEVTKFGIFCLCMCSAIVDLAQWGGLRELLGGIATYFLSP